MLNELKGLVEAKYRDELAKLHEVEKQNVSYKRRTESYTYNFDVGQNISDIDQAQKDITDYVANYKQKFFLNRLLYRRQYKNELASLLEVLEEVKDEIRDLPKPEYYDRQEELLTKTRALTNQMKNLKDVQTLNELGLSFDQALILLKENNIEFCLTEEDVNLVAEKNIYYQRDKHYKSLNEMILVHKTAFAPSNDEIKSNINSNAFFERKFVLDKTTKVNKIKDFRDTIHFCINGEVSSHGFNIFDHRKYAVLQPMTDEIAKKTKNFNPADTYFEGNFKLDKAYILCPETEKETLSKANPSSMVVPYEGLDVDERANALLSILGYQYEPIGMWNWDKQNSGLERIADELKHQYHFKHDNHFQSEDKEKEESLKRNDQFNKFMNFLIETINKENLNPYEVYQTLPQLFADNNVTIFWTETDGKKIAFAELDKIIKEASSLYKVPDVASIIEAMHFPQEHEAECAFWKRVIAKETEEFQKNVIFQNNWPEFYRKLLYIKCIVDSNLIDYPVKEMADNNAHKL